jgi:aminoglycoside phosphotransferase (APT) family kinase protein
LQCKLIPGTVARFDQSGSEHAGSVTGEHEFGPVAERHRFDAAALERHLCRRLAGFEGPLTLKQFEGGQSNPTFLISSPSGDYVLRKKPPGRLLPSAHAVDREYRILKALADTDVPVPRVQLYCPDASIIGTPFYVMEFLAGRVHRDPLLPGVAPADRAAIYDGMNETLARLHAVDWKAAGLADYGKTESYVARQLARWSKQYEASKTGEDPSMQRVMAWLAANTPAGETVTIAHGDYRLQNLVLHPREPRIIGVLDWELSTLGNPIGDLAFNCMTYHLPTNDSLARGFLGTDIEALGIPGEEEYVAAYCQRSGRDEIGEWRFFLVFSLFRTAAIMQGVYARALQGNASSAEAHGFRDLFGIAAAAAWSLAEG